MQGDIVFVDYERSSWKYMSYERGFAKENLEAFKIDGTYLPHRDTIEPFLIGGYTDKGGGSAYGGKRKPSKPDDERFLGNPGDINRSGEKETHIGDDGKADRERHNTTNPNPKYHTSPHDHDVYWDEWGPHLGPAINYPDGAPAFKRYRSCYMSERMISRNTPEENRFKTISNFKRSLKLGGEVVFLWNGVQYGVFGNKEKYCIAHSDGSAEKWCNTADEVLEYMVGSDHLRDVITQVKVLERTI